MGRRSGVKRAAREAAKKHPKVFMAFIVIILVLAVIVGAYWYFFIYEKKERPDGTQVGSGQLSEISSAELSIHFIAPAVKASGDSALIKVGDTEVLIDAGPTQGNVTQIKKYLQDYCTDGILEYVIVTHADSDHIAGMVGTSSGGTYNGILYSYEIGTVITFDRTNKEEKTNSGNPTLYGRYLTALDHAEENGAQVCTALQCWNNADGAQRTYYLDEDRTVSMDILYNYFYEHDSSDENNYSVCMQLSQDLGNTVNRYLFTGDLEEEGEKYLVEYNDLDHVVLYKAGHHGSKTSSNECLLEAITPDYVAVCCCAGYNEYGAAEENIFPTQAFIDRISAYTDKIYVTIMWDEETDGYALMNGDIVFYYGKGEEEDGKSLKLWCSNNATILKDTDWFRENRTWSGGGVICRSRRSRRKNTIPRGAISK